MKLSVCLALPVGLASQIALFKNYNFQYHFPLKLFIGFFLFAYIISGYDLPILSSTLVQICAH